MSEAEIIFVLGGPGSGKGTQCAKLVERYAWGHVSTGDLLRAEVAAESELGLQCKQLMEEGKMVPDEIIVDLLSANLAKTEHKVVLVDGFPRKIEQIQLFEDKIKPCSKAIYMTVSPEAMEERLLKRGQDSGRADDNAETIKNRLKVFEEESLPVVDKLDEQGKVVRIDAGVTVDKVFEQLTIAFDDDYPIVVHTEEEIKAATRIQAIQRGKMARKEVEQLKEQRASGSVVSSSAAQETAAGSEQIEEAASTVAGQTVITDAQETATSAEKQPEVSPEVKQAEKEPAKEQATENPQEGGVPPPAKETAPTGATIPENQPEEETAESVANLYGQMTAEEISESEAAAVKIQAVQRGKAARKKAQALKEEQSKASDSKAATEVSTALESNAESTAVSVNTGEQSVHDTKAETVQSEIADTTTAEPVQSNVQTREFSVPATQAVGPLSDAELKSLKLVAISGPTGVGKKVLIEKLRSEMPSLFGVAVSYTTRPKRPEDVDGEYFYFRSESQMNELLNNGELAEHNQVNGHTYATSWSELRRINQQGRVCLLSVDINGARSLKQAKLGLDAHYIFIAPYSTTDIEQRLAAREDVPQSQIDQMVSQAEQSTLEAKRSDLFNIIINHRKQDRNYYQIKDFLSKVFPDSVDPPSIREIPSRQYMEKSVVQLLRLALRELNRARPDDPVQYLADYLVENKQRFYQEQQRDQDRASI